MPPATGVPAGRKPLAVGAHGVCDVCASSPPPTKPSYLKRPWEPLPCGQSILVAGDDDIHWVSEDMGLKDPKSCTAIWRGSGPAPDPSPARPSGGVAERLTAQPLGQDNLVMNGVPGHHFSLQTRAG